MQGPATPEAASATPTPVVLAAMPTGAKATVLCVRLCATTTNPPLTPALASRPNSREGRRRSPEVRRGVVISPSRRGRRHPARGGGRAGLSRWRQKGSRHNWCWQRLPNWPGTRQRSPTRTLTPLSTLHRDRSASKNLPCPANLRRPHHVPIAPRRAYIFAYAVPHRMSGLVGRRDSAGRACVSGCRNR